MDIAQFLDYDDDDDDEVNSIQGHRNPFYVDHAAEAADAQEQVADIARRHAPYHRYMQFDDRSKSPVVQPPFPESFQGDINMYCIDVPVGPVLSSAQREFVLIPSSHRLDWPMPMSHCF